MKYSRTLPGELSYHHPSHCPADHPGGLNPDSRHQFHALWCISYVTLGNSRELSGWHLLLSSCIRNPLFLRLPFLASLYLAHTIVFLCSQLPFQGSQYTAYSLLISFPLRERKRKNQREEYHKATCTLYQVDLDHTSLSTTTPFTF